MAKSRNLFLRMWQDIKKSLTVKPPEYLGKLKGEDYMGNKYYEIGADPAVGRRYASRWFESKNPDDLMQEIPPEWMSWLRRQRNDPPTHEEIIRNLAMAKMKQENSAKIEKKFGSRKDDSKFGERPFPRYPDYD